MSKLPEYYVDGIAKSYQHNGTLRLEFFAVTDKEQKIEPELNLKLLTSISGFLRMVQVVNDTFNKMKEQGIVPEKVEENNTKEAKEDKKNE